MLRQPFQRDVHIVLIFAGDDVDTDLPISQGLQIVRASSASPSEPFAALSEMGS